MLERTFNELTNRQRMLERMLIESRASLDTIKRSALDHGRGPRPGGGGVLLTRIPAEG